METPSIHVPVHADIDLEADAIDKIEAVIRAALVDGRIGIPIASIERVVDERLGSLGAELLARHGSGDPASQDDLGRLGGYLSERWQKIKAETHVEPPIDNRGT